MNENRKESLVVGARISKTFKEKMQQYMKDHGFETPSELVRTALRDKIDK